MELSDRGIRGLVELRNMGVRELLNSRIGEEGERGVKEQGNLGI